MSIKDKLTDAAESVSDAAKGAACWVRDKVGGEPMGITEHMDVYSADMVKVAVIDHMEDGAIKLTRSSSPDDQHHYIPTSWVAKVHDHVHLNKDAATVHAEWKTDAKSCASCGC